MIAIPAKKGRGIDDLLSSLDAALPEEVKKVPSSPSSTLSQTLQQYSEFCHQWGRYELVNARESFGYMHLLKEEKIMLGSLGLVLTPEQINLVLQMIIVNESNDTGPRPWSIGNIGLFTSMHIQHSYEAGYNDFLLDFSNGTSKFTSVGAGLDGGRITADRPNSQLLRVTVRGDIGDLFADRAQKVDFTVDGTLHGGIDGRYCVFRTPNPLTGHNLNCHVPPRNKIVRICLDGTEITVRNFDDGNYHKKY